VEQRGAIHLRQPLDGVDGFAPLQPGLDVFDQVVVGGLVGHILHQHRAVRSTCAVVGDVAGHHERPPAEVVEIGDDQLPSESTRRGLGHRFFGHGTRHAPGAEGVDEPLLGHGPVLLEERGRERRAHDAGGGSLRPHAHEFGEAGAVSSQKRDAPVIK
jgi:hypothetical protein